MAKNTIGWSDEAKADLKRILDFYIRRNGNAKYSLKLSKRIKKTVSLLKNKSILVIHLTMATQECYRKKIIAFSMKFIQNRL